MNNPRVVAIMLYADRRQFLDRAVTSFRAQAYENKTLVIIDNGQKWIRETNPTFDEKGISMYMVHPGRKIGALRNLACDVAVHECGADVIMHWDSDDWSAPERMADQVAFLQQQDGAPGRPIGVVGYSDMLFWRSEQQLTEKDIYGPEGSNDPCDVLDGQAWVYRSLVNTYCLGTSLCYWRDSWRSHQFRDDKPERPGAEGEDTVFCREQRCASKSVFGGNVAMMVAAIHGGNHSDYSLAHMERAKEWRRAKEWDSIARGIMEPNERTG